MGENETVELWMAYYSDWSGFAIFTDELSAMRFAVDHQASVIRLEPGQWAHDQVRAQWEQRREADA